MLFLHEVYMHRDRPAHRMRSRSMIVNPLLTRGSCRIYEITGRRDDLERLFLARA